jgi:deoxyribodipyrimidine photo-lyase
MTSSASIVFFQNDLRMRDNPVLAAAVHRGNPLICLFVWNPDASGYAKAGAASRWWLYHSLHTLADNLAKAGNTLILRIGHAPEVIAGLVRHLGVIHLYWNLACEPTAFEEEQKILTFHESEHAKAALFHGNTLVDPSTVRAQAQQPYSVFTPFWKRFQTHSTLEPPVHAPRHLPPALSAKVQSNSLASLKLLPVFDWAQGLREAWSPGEDGAQSLLRKFLQAPVQSYETDRNRPDISRTSHLSPHLHFGEISPRDIWHALDRAAPRQTTAREKAGLMAFRGQLVWREFSRHLLVHFPHMAHQPLRMEFQQFPWRAHPEFRQARQQGQTGYPLIDAGMRELWHTGWMHNRMRMVVASFLTKHLLLHGQEGAQWFWDTLVDADQANNTFGWQWVAGCGADAAPFFRIFNPIMQGRKFDPDGAYVRRWVPELSKLSQAWIHAPWEAPSSVLQEADVKLGKTYPFPIVNRAEARSRALEAYQRFKNLRSRNIREPVTTP